MRTALSDQNWSLTRIGRHGLLALLGFALVAVAASDVHAQTSNRPSKSSRISAGRDEVRPAKDEVLIPPAPEAAREIPQPLGLDVNNWTSPQGLGASLKVMLLLTVLSLAPAILMMTTCFIRFVVVLSLLRQALGTQQLPPNQVIISLCLFLTFLVMSPIWNRAYQEGIRPYTNPAAGEQPLDEATAMARVVAPLREFMSEQIELADNSDAVWMFLDFQAGTQREQSEDPASYADVPLSVLVPAYMLSELKVAFLIGFQIYLPFVIIDMVISSILISMGMMMLPPVLVSLPFKLLLFVLIDGWTLTVGMLLQSVRPTG
ncbi:MAG: flagellar type III secretion system pore protein FliP [Planctomycetaceae bacterium]